MVRALVVLQVVSGSCEWGSRGLNPGPTDYESQPPRSGLSDVVALGTLPCSTRDSCGWSSDFILSRRRSAVSKVLARRAGPRLSAEDVLRNWPAALVPLATRRRQAREGGLSVCACRDS